MAAAVPLLLAGLLPIDSGLEERWSLGGRWLYPVGDPHIVGRPGPDGDPGYSVTRNVGGPRSARHRGADLSNRRAGGVVRAAAHGIVVSAADAGNGFGRHVVIAHRLPEGDLVYSVYAHLLAKSVQVSPGERVVLGQRLGRVGSTGDATAPHLHFEVRRPSDPGERWEKAEAVDPVAFVAARLPTRDRDSTWARPYLEWAECAGIIAPEDAATAPVSRGRWRRALAAALCPSRPFGLGTRPDHITLSSKPALETRDAVGPLDLVTWPELARDLSRAKGGFCSPPDSTPAEIRRESCRRRYDDDRPGAHPQELRHRKGLPTFADVSLILIDAASR